MSIPEMIAEYVENNEGESINLEGITEHIVERLNGESPDNWFAEPVHSLYDVVEVYVVLYANEHPEQYVL
ncbi:MAG: hypothetical protein JRC86_00610 [Deltaproteobacteria bacterium]|nr:hypothetical protein [Deltaproteobacteria bacterium]